MDDDLRSISVAMDKVLNKIRSSTPGKMNAGLERQYGQYYQQLVRAGVKPQIRRKYRG